MLGFTNISVISCNAHIKPDRKGGVMFDIPPGVSKYDNQGGFRQPGKTRTAVSD